MHIWMYSKYNDSIMYVTESKFYPKTLVSRCRLKRAPHVPPRFPLSCTHGRLPTQCTMIWLICHMLLCSSFYRSGYAAHGLLTSWPCCGSRDGVEVVWPWEGVFYRICRINERMSREMVQGARVLAV